MPGDRLAAGSAAVSSLLPAESHTHESHPQRHRQGRGRKEFLSPTAGVSRSAQLPQSKFNRHDSEKPCGRFRCRKKICKYKSVPLDDFSYIYWKRTSEHWTSTRERVEFSVFAARVHFTRQFPEQFRVEPPSGEGAIESCWIDASNVRRKATLEHFLCKKAGILPPKRKYGFHTACREMLLAISTNILEKQITKYDVKDSLCPGAFHY